MSAIHELIKIVERGEPFPIGRKADARGGDPLSLARNWGQAYDAYHGSLDAALSLHQAVLPGWEFVVYFDSAEVSKRTSDGNLIVVDYHTADAELPARAWLLAILKALAACEAGHG